MTYSFAQLTLVTISLCLSLLGQAFLVFNLKSLVLISVPVSKSLVLNLSVTIPIADFLLIGDHNLIEGLINVVVLLLVFPFFSSFIQLNGFDGGSVFQFSGNYIIAQTHVHAFDAESVEAPLPTFVEILSCNGSGKGTAVTFVYLVYRI